MRPHTAKPDVDGDRRGSGGDAVRASTPTGEGLKKTTANNAACSKYRRAVWINPSGIRSRIAIPAPFLNIAGHIKQAITIRGI
jgi:hypothetical protein